MKRIKYVSLTTLFISLISGSLWAQDTLSGNWGGLRDEWAQQGVELELVYTAEYFKVHSGGLRQHSVTLDNVDLMASFDGEKLFGLQGASFFLYVLGNNGASPSEHAGDFQGVSNIDAPDAWKVYEAWYDQSFADDQASVRVGLYDLNSEFDVIESAGLFIHPSFGIGPDYSQSGQNGPSIFPTTSLALRLAYTLDTNYYIQAAILDGVPGDLGNDNGTQIQLGDNEGALYALELGYTQGGEGAADRYAKWALGAWYYSEKFDDLMDIDSNDNPIRRNNNQGIYALAEYEFFRESDLSEQGATAFVRYGIANDDVNQIDSYFGSGIVYTGLLPGRNEDQFGIAIAIASNGSKYKQWQISEGNRVDDRETAIELSYRMQVFPWLAIQPDLQWIKNPSMDPSISDVTMVGVRTEIVF